MPSLDTNCLLRWLLDDVPEQTAIITAVDCYLEVFARNTGAAPLLTFDKKMGNQLSGVKLLSP
jgi:predicted nucleic-acid-binding protein